MRAARVPGAITDTPLVPTAARWQEQNGAHRAVLTYADARAADDPRGAVLDFYESAYRAGASRAGWPIDALSCHRGATDPVLVALPARETQAEHDRILRAEHDLAVAPDRLPTAGGGVAATAPAVPARGPTWRTRDTTPRSRPCPARPTASRGPGRRS